MLGRNSQTKLSDRTQQALTTTTATAEDGLSIDLSTSPLVGSEKNLNAGSGGIRTA